jgi:hypothetical protein
LDEIEVARQTAPSEGLASEPLTVAATLTLGTTAILAVTRLIEKYLEQKRQKETMVLISSSFAASTEAGQLVRLAKDYNGVSLKWGITKADAKRGKDGT